MGCYRDNGRPRLLTGFKTKFSDNSPEKCLNICLQSGFALAGLQSKEQCFCGNELSGSPTLDKVHCNMSCSGTPEHSCGGLQALDIYKTGLKCKKWIQFIKTSELSLIHKFLNLLKLFSNSFLIRHFFSVF